MVIGALQVTLAIPARSLKEKRSVVRRTLDRVRHRHHVAAAEVDANDVHHRAVIGFAAVANDESFVNSSLDKVLSQVEDDNLGRADVIDSRLELVRV